MKPICILLSIIPIISYGLSMLGLAVCLAVALGSMKACKWLWK